jgi:sulfur transfer complex TusBCD TusB component (DsrH family)
LETVTAAPVVRTDMVLTTSPILKKVNILLIQEGVDYIIKNYYLSAATISNLAYIKDQVWVTLKV